MNVAMRKVPLARLPMPSNGMDVAFTDEDGGAQLRYQIWRSPLATNSCR